ncbi:MULTISPECIES: TolC family protein [Psychrilyobacter]|uniref:TolC family protein n=1 Tax=Psychrilyobacter piezotolerans TaxID=2293438 RepID=A0ABX9KKK0_9FUSO|nr:MULTISPECIES: TolC family protein [Psychrilyobacter]MCS5423129.1 TolC family protein [Psychrilyobacter sp. S5]NDI76295.1 TolC family protein [Psychrilyobacter piezotolerans]RDE65895.1 TolC family protein [Psychrilyobacter sp. S5]REI43073.1 TolC family protein [Psychrilyobacter piezotolerans]
MKKRFLILALMTITSLNVFSKDLNLEEALKIAENENPEIRRERITLDIKKLEERKKKKAFLPKVSISVDGSDTAYDDNLNPFDKSAGVEARISMPLFTGGKLTNEYKKSRLESEKISLTNILLKYDIRKDVIEKYFEVLNLKKQADILLGVNNTLNKQRERLEKLYSSNKLVKKSDVLRVKSDILGNEVTLLGVNQQAEIKTYELQILLGISMDEPLNIEEFDYTALDLNKFFLDGDIAKALDEGSRVKKSEIDLKKSEIDVNIARAAYYPKVGLGFEKNFKRDSDGLDSYRIAVGFNWNIFSWGADMDTVAQNQYRVDQAAIDLRKMKDEVVLELKEKYSNMMTLSRQVEAQNIKVEIADENAMIDTLRYNNSLMSSFEYLDSIDKLRAAEEDYYTLQRELMLAVDTYENAWR